MLGKSIPGRLDSGLGLLGSSGSRSWVWTSRLGETKSVRFCSRPSVDHAHVAGRLGCHLCDRSSFFPSFAPFWAPRSVSATRWRLLRESLSLLLLLVAAKDLAKAP